MIAASRPVASCSAATHKTIAVLISPSRIGAVSNLVAPSYNAPLNNFWGSESFYLRSSGLNMDDTMILMEDRLADVRKECQCAVAQTAGLLYRRSPTCRASSCSSRTLVGVRMVLARGASFDGSRGASARGIRMSRDFVA